MTNQFQMKIDPNALWEERVIRDNSKNCNRGEFLWTTSSSSSSCSSWRGWCRMRWNEWKSLLLFLHFSLRHQKHHRDSWGTWLEMTERKWEGENEREEMESDKESSGTERTRHGREKSRGKHSLSHNFYPWSWMSCWRQWMSNGWGMRGQRWDSMLKIMTASLASGISLMLEWNILLASQIHLNFVSSLVTQNGMN